jgi:hypothetical protein
MSIGVTYNSIRLRTALGSLNRLYAGNSPLARLKVVLQLFNCMERIIYADAHELGI